MKRYTTLLLICLFFTSNSIAQRENILKGTSEFRKIVLQQFEQELVHTELIRQKLDSAGITRVEYDLFMKVFTYLSKTKDKGRLRANSHYLDQIKDSRVYAVLSNEEIQFLLQGAHLSEFGKLGLWEERYPHKLRYQSSKFSEIQNIKINEGEDVLLYKPVDKIISSILLLTYNDLNLIYFPYKYSKSTSDFFQLISSQNTLSSSTLKYPYASSSKIDDSMRYDKIIVNAGFIMYYSQEEDIKYEFRKLFDMLRDDGTLIISTNRVGNKEGLVDIPVLDKKLKKAFKVGFDLKDRTVVEDEFLVYSLVKG